MIRKAFLSLALLLVLMVSFTWQANIISNCNEHKSLLRECAKQHCNVKSNSLKHAIMENPKVSNCVNLKCKDRLSSFKNCRNVYEKVRSNIKSVGDDGTDDDTDDDSGDLCSNCPPGNECCNGLCYNPQVFDCVSTILCPKGLLACNRACYNETLFSCVDGELVGTGVDDVDQDRTCDNCPEGNECCDNQCFDPAKFDCVNGTLCPEGLLSCHGACYDQSKYKCENGNLISIGSGDDDDDDDDTDEGLCGLCPEGQECCDDRVAGPQCYEPNKYVCIQGVELCPESHLACGNKCYDPTKYQCVDDQLVLIDDDDDDTDEGLCGLCPEGQECCDDRVSGPKCYDPNVYVCIQGVQLCPETYLACGDKCYDPTKYQCVDDQLVAIEDPVGDNFIILGESTVIQETGASPRRYIVVEDSNNAPTGLEVEISTPRAVGLLITRENEEPEDFDELPAGFEQLNGDFNGFVFNVDSPTEKDDIVITGEYNLNTANLGNSVGPNENVAALQFDIDEDEFIVLASESNDNIVKFSPQLDVQGRALVYFMKINRNLPVPLDIGSSVLFPSGTTRSYLFDPEEDDVFGDTMLFRVTNPSRGVLVTLEQFDNENPLGTDFVLGEADAQPLWFTRYRTEISPFDENARSLKNSKSTVTSDSTIEIRYNELEGLDESSLRVYMYDSATTAWVLKDSELDEANNIITIDNVIPEDQPSSVIISVVGQPIEGEEIDEGEVVSGVSKLDSNVYSALFTVILLISMFLTQ